jgi:hypothetical protein
MVEPSHTRTNVTCSTVFGMASVRGAQPWILHGGIDERVLAQVSIPLSCLDLGMPVHGIRIDDYLRKRRRVFYLGARTHGRISSRALSTCAALIWRALARALGIHGIVGEQAQVFEDVVTVV